MSKTKKVSDVKKGPAKSEQNGQVSDVNAEFEAAYHEAEKILRRCYVDGTQPTFAEVTFFASRLGWDEKEQRKQAGRVGRVVKTQLICGTSKEREALKNTWTAARKHTEKRGAELHAIIENAQKELGDIEQNERRLEKRTEEVQAALKHLSDCIPTHVHDEFNRRVRHIKSTIGARANELKIAINFEECLVDPSLHATPKAYAQTVQRYNREFVDETKVERTETTQAWQMHRPAKKTHWREMTIKPEWEKQRRSIKGQLPKKRKQLEALEAELEAELGAAKELLKIYWR